MDMFGADSSAKRLDPVELVQPCSEKLTSRTIASPVGVVEDGRSDHLDRAQEQLASYFAGRLRRFAVPLDPRGTPFQRQVWAALAAIPYGETRSYGAVAAAIGQPTASRAVGAANGRNPVSIIVPCHRVVGSGGGLTGFAGGLEAKRRLLSLECSAGALF